MSNFTPGKWLHDEASGDVYVMRDDELFSDRKFPIAYVSSLNHWDEEYRHVYEEELKANARLIAAAPEMYELLSVIYRDMRHDELFDALYKAGQLLVRIDGADGDE